MSYTANVPLFSRDVAGYTPIDVLMAHPRIRILRLLSRFDWLSGFEIREQLGVAYSPEIKNAYASHLSRMRKAGLLLARPCPAYVRGNSTGDAHGGGPDYRISPRAKADLPKLIARASRP